MQLSIAGARRVQPPPLWFVTNGEITVGPVRTGLLLKGVVHGRIPEECMVRELRWKSWRGLAQIREIRELRRRQAWGILAADTPAPPSAGSAEIVLRRARDAGETLLFALNVAVKRTGASVGAVHRVAGPWSEPVTCCARGPGMHGLLGGTVPEDDLMLGAARARRIVIGRPGETEVHRAAAQRLDGSDHPLRGVLMAPVCDGRELIAMIELGRTDHPFRTADAIAFEKIVGVAARHIRAN